MKALVLVLSVASVWGRPTTVVNFSPVGDAPGVAPGFAYAFRAPATLANSQPGAPDAPADGEAPGVIKTQYHSQDQLGQYAFGYVGAASSAHEVRTMDGAVRGSFTYLDANQQLQTATYVADKDGYRVEATNLPGVAAHQPLPLPEPVQPTPEVLAATLAHLRAVEEIRAARAKKAMAAAEAASTTETNKVRRSAQTHRRQA